MSHKELVNLTAKWLKKHKNNIAIPNCPTIAKELTTVTSSGEIPDVLGFSSRASVLCEIKTSRSDFFRDKKKVFRQIPELGMGDYRYFVCHMGIIDKTDLPKGWGLLIVDDKKISVEQLSEWHKANYQCERTLLLSIIRRAKIK